MQGRNCVNQTMLQGWYLMRWPSDDDKAMRVRLINNQQAENWRTERLEATGWGGKRSIDWAWWIGQPSWWWTEWWLGNRGKQAFELMKMSWMRSSCNQRWDQIDGKGTTSSVYDWPSKRKVDKDDGAKRRCRRGWRQCQLRVWLIKLVQGGYLFDWLFRWWQWTNTSNQADTIEITIFRTGAIEAARWSLEQCKINRNRDNQGAV